MNQKTTNLKPVSKNKILKRKEKAKNLIQTISNINPMLGANIGLNAFMTPFFRKKKTNIFPEGTTKTKTKIEGKEVTLYRYGKSSRKILLVHGWEGASSDFGKFFEPLKNSGFEVWAIDLPGHGASGISQLNAVIASKILRNIEIYYGPFNGIVGHSFGAFSTGYAISQYEELKNIPFVSIGSPNKLKNILKNFSDLVGFTPLQEKYIFAKIENKLNIRIDDFEQGKLVRDHNGPVLFVHDKDDLQVNIRVIDEIQSHFPNAEYFVTQGLGHNRILRDEPTITSIVNFFTNWRDTRPEIHDALKFGLI